MTSSIARPRDLKRVISAWLVRPAWRLSSTWPISATTWSWPRSPARMGITRSPASARADWRLSANTVAAATASVDSSRTVGRQAPTAFTCAPGASMPPVTTGSTLATAVQTRLAPSSASATDSRTSTGGPKRSPAHSASALAWAWVRLQTRMRSSRRTAAIASRWLRAWVPAPTIARSRASEAASARVATADTAPVRISVIAAASSTAVGTPVWGSNMVTVPWWVSRPRAGFPGWMVTVLIPKPRSGPAHAGMAAIMPAAPDGWTTIRSGWTTAAASMTSIGLVRSSGGLADGDEPACRLVRSTIPWGDPEGHRGRAGGSPGMAAGLARSGRPGDPAREADGAVGGRPARPGGEQAAVEPGQIARALGDGAVQPHGEHGGQQQRQRAEQQSGDGLAAVEGPPAGGPGDADGAQQHGDDAEQPAEGEQHDRQHQREAGRAHGQRGDARAVPRGEPQHRRQWLAHGSSSVVDEGGGCPTRNIGADG